MFYPIYVKDGTITRIGKEAAKGFHPASKNVSIKKSGETEVWPIDQNGIERRWNFGLDTIEDELFRIIAVESDGEIDLFLSEEDSTPKTVWTGGDLEAGKHGASLVRTIIQKEFPYPKSLYATKNASSWSWAIVRTALSLDFFGGSGTTLHATALLNAERKTSHQCILVTNNEVGEKKKNNCSKGTFTRR